MSLFKPVSQSVPSNLLKDRYRWPPFSILNTIQSDWQKRKDEWEALGIFSSKGRDVKRYNATPTNTFSARGLEAKKAESISTFDPFLCELMYRWFSNDGYFILDPFAGGSVRGIVASVLNRDYLGIDLSETQITENYSQWDELHTRYSGLKRRPAWCVGDSEDVLNHSAIPLFDMVFTCPPYYNLEKYSTDGRDLSNAKTYEEFLKHYKVILKKSAEHLKEGRFFVIVVSEVRADSHNLANSEYIGLVPDTITILRDYAGLKYYNEIILENNIGSLPIRAPKYFNQSRKIGRHHQNILVFYKGDLRDIEKNFSNYLL